MRIKHIIVCVGTGLIFVSALWAEPGLQPPNNIKTVNHAFKPGEKLTYSISWSSIVEAGIAVMEVKEGAKIDNRPTYQFSSTTRSVGIVETAYPIRDSVESIVDAEGLYSISFDLHEQHGKRRRQRRMTFDHDKETVQCRVNEDPPQTSTVPPRVQDALSSLYYMRTREDFIIGRHMLVDVHDSGKTWSVEIHVLGKEKIKTPAGTFDTIKVKTYPKYEGVFMHKGEIYIWITDDVRRIPVLMQSVISIGSIVATLTKTEGVKSKP
jgi:hypothetical protein